MAKQIKKGEIIVDGVLDNHIQQLKEVKELYSEIDGQIKKTAQSAKAGIGGVDPNSAEK